MNNYLLLLTRWQFSLSFESSNLTFPLPSIEFGLDLPSAGIVEEDDPDRDIDDSLEEVEDSFVDLLFELILFEISLLRS